MDWTQYEEALLRNLRAIIRAEINTRIDIITEAQKNENDFEIEDYRSDIDEMIRDYINYNVSVTLDC